MTRNHFSKMTPSEVSSFNRDMKVLTGMLYSIVTLRAFFPNKSPAPITDNTSTQAPYPMPSQKAGDQEEQNNPL